MRILVIEDDPTLGNALREFLGQQGYAVDWLQEGSQVVETLDGQHYDLLLLDLNLPGKSGLEALRELRAAGQTLPVLILTARDSVDDRVAGLDSGADDYVTKPFDPGELLARVRAALRRQQEAAAASNGVVQVGPFQIDITTGDTRREDRPVRLSPMEARFVKMLAQRSGQPVGTRQLTETLWGYDTAEQRQALRVLARKVRCKLEKDPDAPRFLLTEPRLGYRLVDPEFASN